MELEGRPTHHETLIISESPKLQIILSRYNRPFGFHTTLDVLLNNSKIYSILFSEKIFYRKYYESGIENMTKERFLEDIFLMKKDFPALAEFFIWNQFND